MSEMWELPASHQQAPDRRYTTASGHPGAAEDLHAWSIYRQNLNSDFTDSALGTDERSPLPYGNFQLREQTVQSILRHPRLAPRSELGSNMYAYLKFGLPRVFPPNPKSNTGYDSNEEHHHQQQRSRSRMTERDHQQGPRPMNGNGPNRARSETDLRQTDGLIQNRFKKSRPNGGSESNLLEQRLFKSGSQMSLVSRNSRPPISKGFQTPQSLEDNNGLEPYFKHPHLQVRGLTYESTKRKGRILEGISFDLRGGELLAVMSTHAAEGTALLNIVAGHRRSSDRISGEFLLNGNPVALQRLSSRVAFVRNDYRLHPDITVEQTMKYHSMFKRSAKGQSEKRDQMKILLEELGLTAVRHCLVESLTSAERHRLSVACQLQLDTEILVLDQVTKGMDIFDTFFLVEYLRQWATRRARIVLLTIHPPTFEIFSMFTKVTLISTGRTMFYGHRREMLPYFAFIEYPCPGFKNPSDYYLDLVTLDDLSSEALLESSQRIETLADSYRRKQEPLSEPGPPVSLPAKVTNANIFGQIGGIWMYTLFYTFPWNIIQWVMLMLFSAGISICIGTIYWNVRLFSPQDQNSINDRFGMQWTVMAMTPWPVLLLLLIRDHKCSRYIVRDTQDRLYSKAIYIIAKTLIEFPFVISIFLAYIIPAYVMAGLTEDASNFYIFIGYQLLYLYSLRTLSLSALYLFSSRILTSTSLVGVLFLILSLPAGYTIHASDLGDWCKWVKFISPLAWILKPIIYGEMKNIAGLSCPTNPVLLGAGQSNIMRKLECGLQNGPHALTQWDFADTYPIWLPLLATAGFVLIFKIAGFMGFLLRRHAPALPPPEKP